MEVDVGDITEPTHKIGGGGTGKAKEIQEFIVGKLEADETNVADSEIAEAVEMPQEKASYQNIRNHTNLMRKSGLFKWDGTVNKGEHKGEHLYNAGKDSYYFDEDGNLKEEFAKK